MSDVGADNTMSGLAIDAREQAGRYQLHERLGAGGMATVYLASMEGPGGFGKLVAIKRIHPHLAHTPRFVDMFLDEARIVSRIEHPNVCSVFDFGQAQDTYFLAMEYIMGETLLSFLHLFEDDDELDRPQGAERARELIGTPRWHAFVAFVLAEACEGLHAAHELTDEYGQPLNIVHRDVSPDNIFVSYKGAVKVMDFGVARAERRIHHTRTGLIKGKMAYMPPEVLQAAEKIDRRVDVWALGVCLWEMLTGERLFQRDSDLATVSAIAMEPIVAPSEKRSGIPEVLDDIVMAALAKEPGERTATARELGRSLRRFVADSSVMMDAVEAAELVQSLHAESRTIKLAQSARIRGLRGNGGPNPSAEMAAARPTSPRGTGAMAFEPTLTSSRPDQRGTAGSLAFDPTAVSQVLPVDPAGATQDEPVAEAGKAAEERRSRTMLALAILIICCGLAGVAAAIVLRGSLAEDDPVAAAGTSDTAASPSVVAERLPKNPASPPTAPERPILELPDPAPDPAGASEPDEPGTRRSERRRDRDRDSDRDTDRPAESSKPDKPAETEAKPAVEPAGTADKNAKPSPVPAADPAPRPTIDVTKPPRLVQPAPLPAVTTAPPKPVAPAVKPTSFAAVARVASLTAKGSLSRSEVKRAVKRQLAAFEKCYRSAASKAGRNSSIDLKVALEIDEAGWAQRIRAGKAPLPGLSGCVTGAAKKIRSRNAPDVGRVRVNFQLSLRPKAP